MNNGHNETALFMAKSLSIQQNSQQLIEAFSASFEPGQIIAVVGNNGSGKTTLLKTLSGLLPTRPDSIFIGGHDITVLSRKQKATTISFLLQHSPTQHYCTVKSRIAHGLMPLFGYDFYLDKKTECMIEAMAERMQIRHLLNRILSKMSGGEQRLVHIAKCLINPNIKILLLDEPSVFLDFTQQKNLCDVLKEQASKGRLIIFSSHDQGFIERSAQSIMKIAEGRARIEQLQSSSFNFLDNSDDRAVSADKPS